MRRTVLLLVAVVIVASGCAQDETAGEDLEGPVTRTVQVDGTPDDYGAFALAYFPNSVTVRPGDSVRFAQVWTGEPHSVTLGTLVDDTVGALRRLGPDAEPPPELAEAYDELPVMLPEGPGDANQAAVNPCYIEAGGEVPSEVTEPCDVREAPAFDGTQAYHSSGFIAPDEGVDITLSEDIEPGTYVYYCNLHELAMTGEIVVTDDEEIPSQAEVDAARDEQLEQHFAPLTAAYTDDVRAGESDFGVLAGFGADGPPAGTVEFAPTELDVEAGASVTWTVFGPHTISFKVPAEAAALLAQAEDGTWHLNAEAGVPVGGPGQPPPPEGEQELPTEEGPPPEPVNVDGGSWDGEGFRSSGLFLSFPPNLFSYSLTFTEPGEYQYVCIVHPEMTGVVNVT